MLVRLRPTPHHGIALHNHMPGRGLLLTSHHVSDGRQKGADVLCGWWAYELAMLCAPSGTEEVKSVSDGRDPGRVTGQLQAPFRQQRGDTGVYFLFQEGFGRAWKNAVIGTPAPMDFRPRVAPEGWEGSFEGSFQASAGQVHEDWGGYPALWYARIGGIQDVFIHAPRFEPWLEDALLHRDMRHQPVRRNAVKAGADIPFQDPLRRLVQGQDGRTLSERIGWGALATEAVRVGLRLGLRNRIERQQIEGLHGAVVLTRHRERTCPCAAAFGESPTAYRLGVIPTLAQWVYGGGLLFRRVPQDAVYTGGPCALVFRHPFDRQDCGRKRVGEQTLESLHCPPSASLCRLHETCLEPTHQGVGVVPVDGVPGHFPVGDRTGLSGRHLLGLLPRWIQVSRDARPAWEVSPLARGVLLRMLHPSPPHYRVACASSR